MTRPLKLLTTIVFSAACAALIALPGEAQLKRDAGLGAQQASSEEQLEEQQSQPARPATISGPIHSQAVGFAETQAVRDMPSVDLPAPDAVIPLRGEEVNEFNSFDIFTPNPNAPKQYDGALQARWTPDRGFTMDIPAPSLTFEGLSSLNNTQLYAGSTSNPPDTTGAVGPSHYVQSVNSMWRVWDKNGNALIPPKKLSDLWSAIGGLCGTNNQGDPIVLYDRMADRWLISQFAYTSNTAPPFHQCIAISKTGDPTGAYYAYDFITPGNEFNDYFKFGAWPDAYYMTDRQFTAPTGSYNGFGAFAFDRSKMLIGDKTASFIYFNLGPDLSQASSGMLPTDFYGIIPPPAGAPNVFAVYIDDAYGEQYDPVDGLRLYDFTVNWANPQASTFTERTNGTLLVAPFDSRNPSGRTDIEQPPPAAATDAVDSIGDRLMLRLAYVNRNGTELWTTVHTVNAGVIPPQGIVYPTREQYKAGTRWYVLQRTTGAPTADRITVQDQGTFSPDVNERWMGSSALDHLGNLAVGYSIVNGVNLFPSIAYAGRLATDAAGTLSGEQMMFTGSGVQQASGNRWGDYTNMSLDPSDDATFWYTNEYIQTTGTFNWQTRIGRFKFAESTAPAQGTLSGNITDCDTGMPLSDAIVTVTGGPSNGYSSTSYATGNYSFKVAPGTYQVMITNAARNCTAKGPFEVTITDGGTTTLNECLDGGGLFAFQSNALSGGDGDGAIDTNECNELNVTMVNNGCGIASGTTAVLSTNTPGVEITQPNSAYPNTVPGGTATNSTPFQFSTKNDFVCGTPINFTLTVTSDAGTNSFTFTMPTCGGAPVSFSGSLAAGDATQPGRLGRNTPSSCSGKACPGLFNNDQTARRYDTYTLTNGPTATCATFSTTAACTTGQSQIITAAYLNSYNPNNLCENYLGDGASGTSFSTNIPANATVVLVVSEASGGTTGCANYSVNVTGLVGNNIGSGFCGAPSSVVSRKSHNGENFDINLPLAGTPAIESRGTTGGNNNYQLVYTFPNPVNFQAASVTSGTGSVVSTTGNGTTEVTVNLTGVTNAQKLTVTLFGVNNGTFSTNVAVTMRVLVGDTRPTGAVNSADVIYTKSQLGQAVTASNFRADVNASGEINNADVTLVKSLSGTGVQ